MLRSTKKTPTRRLARVAMAGALVAVPLAALAATASAETPEPSASVEVQAAPIDGPEQGIDFDGHPRHHRGAEGPHHGPGDRPGPDGPGRLFHEFHQMPPTGSS